MRNRRNSRRNTWGAGVLGAFVGGVTGAALTRCFMSREKREAREGPQAAAAEVPMDRGEPYDYSPEEGWPSEGRLRPRPGLDDVTKRGY
ncbi:MAG: hypothetical protein L0Y66_05255 [Myxococcaceae bacterium]|nr:hypothetical protein [Myxococcaceae bacterium]MCI0670579.1 hypothetical protein [Myxococcaceae bacterium]